MIQCLNCGATNEDNSKFCSKCGNSLVNSNVNYQQSGSQQNFEQRGRNDPRRIDMNQHTNNGPGVNDSRRVDNQRGRNDPRRIDESKHTSNQPRVNTQPTINNPQTINNQQRTNQNTYNKSNGSIFDKISNLSLPVKIIGLIAICCIGIFIVGALMGGVSDQGSLSSDNSYSSSSYGGIFDSFSKSGCKEINYNQLNNYPDNYYGDNIKISGRVLQIVENSYENNYLLMYVNDNYNQLAYVEYYNNTNIAEDDYITVYGVFAGRYSYTTTNGGTNSVPSLYGAILE
jgi:hypothetical protein